MWGICREGVKNSLSLGAKVIFSWLGPLLCPLLCGATTKGLVSQGSQVEISENYWSLASKVCCPFKGMVMADTGYWRVGEAGLGKQPEGAIWSKLLWDPCHGIFTGPTCSWRFSLADSPYTTLCIFYPFFPSAPRTRSLGPGEEGTLRWIPLPGHAPAT